MSMRHTVGAVAAALDSAASEGPKARAYHGSIPFSERVTCTVPEACQAIGRGRTKLYELIADGGLRTMTIGRRRLVVVSSLLNLIAETGMPAQQ